MQFFKRDINRQNRNGDVTFYNVGDTSSQSSSSGVTLDQVRRNFVSIDFFKRLFQAHDSTDSDNILNIDPNDTDSTITDLEFKFGSWSSYFISALGRNSSGGGGGSVGVLDDLDDVDTTGAANGKVLTYQNGMWIPGTGGGSGSVSWADITDKPTTLSGYGITDAIPLGGSNYITGTLRPNTNNSINLGSSSYRWSSVYGVNGSFSSSLTVGGTDVSLAGHTHSASDITSGTFAAARIPTGISITGNAATATKATQDGDGNVITSKYVTLDTTQTVTGSKTFSSTIKLSGAGIEDVGGAGLLAYRLAWAGSDVNSWTAGTIDSRGIIRSTNQDLLHYRYTGNANQSTTWPILDTYNYDTYLDDVYVNKSGDTMTGNLSVEKSGNSTTIVKVTNSSGSVGIETTNNRGVWDYTTGVWLLGTNGTNTWLNGGNVGIGTNSPGYKLHVNGTGYFSSDVQIRNTSYGGVAFTLASANYSSRIFTISQRNTSGSWVANYMIFGSNGYVGVGNQYPSQLLHVGGNILAEGAVTALSDMRRKSPVSEVNTRIEDLAKLPVFYYKWKMGYDDDMHIGTSAQEVQKLFPELVIGKEDLSVNYPVLGTTLGILNSRKLTSHEKEIKALKKENKALKERIKALEDRV